MPRDVRGSLQQVLSVCINACINVCINVIMLYTRICAKYSILCYCRYVVCVCVYANANANANANAKVYVCIYEHPLGHTIDPENLQSRNLA